MAQSRSPRRPTLRVLVVDDDPEIRDFIQMALEDEGHEVLAAPNGAAALDLLLARRAAPPDVILLDMNMPVMDGHAFAEAYRRLAPPHAPIVVVTAAGNAADRARQLAAAAFLGKPFALDDLCACVERHGRRAA